MLNKSKENDHELCCSSSHSPRPSSSSLIRWPQVATSDQNEKRPEVLPERRAFIEISVTLQFTQRPISALVMRTEGLRTQIRASFSSFIAVGETVEMLKQLRYTQDTQFYSRISPTYGFNYPRYKVYAILHHHERRLKKNRLAIFIQVQKLYHSNML